MRRYGFWRVKSEVCSNEGNGKVSEDRIILSITDGVATITLNRPDVGNALDIPTVKELAKAVDHFAADDAVRCVVLTGAGRLFCAGGDIASMAGAGDGLPDMLGDLIAALHRVLVALIEMPKPLLTLVNGPAAGAGFSMAISGDVVIAGKSASFLAAYGGIGLTADGGMSWLLPRLIGLRQAQRLILLNEKVGADEAGAIGLVTQVVEDDDLLSVGQTMAYRLKTSAMSSIGGSRALLRESLQSDYATQLERERQSMMEAARGSENSEGVAAFLQKRKPDFEKAN
ncbi:enoyl-CoA hydratase/isomerase family protein [Erythrobacter alti]|uniref:enoyl-CoA hydratase/isomerase family protein n=1 Tax=Erythrobacter alti TaxID=1896145 RepID=UPI0030F41054